MQHLTPLASLTSLPMLGVEGEDEDKGEASYPSSSLDNLQRIGEYGCHRRGSGSQPEGRGASDLTCYRAVPPLQQLVHGELDGRVGDEEQGGAGAVPEAGQALLHPHLGHPVQEPAVPGPGGRLTLGTSYLGAVGSRPAIFSLWLTTHRGLVRNTFILPAIRR